MVLPSPLVNLGAPLQHLAFQFVGPHRISVRQPFSENFHTFTETVQGKTDDKDYQRLGWVKSKEGQLIANCL